MRCFSDKMSRTTARFVVADMAWDLLASVGRMQTILRLWVAAQTALTFSSRVSLQVYRKPVSMFMTYPLPAEVPMFSTLKCLQSKRNAVERASAYYVFDQSLGRSLRAVALAGRRWSSSMVTSPSWRSAAVELTQSFKFARASFLVRAMVNCAYGTKSIRGDFVFSAVIGIFAGLMSASVRMQRKRTSRSRFVKDVASSLRRWVVSQSGQGSREAPGPSVPQLPDPAPTNLRCVQSNVESLRLVPGQVLSYRSNGYRQI